MRIAVTGASGFVGPAAIRRLAAEGCHGYAISRREMGALPRGWRWVLRREALEWSGFAAGERPPDWLVHLEVKQHVPSPTEQDRREFREVNVDGTRAWLAWCERLGVSRIAFFSTIKAVGESDRCQDESAVSEPTTDYGRSKRAGEQLVREWAAHPARAALILRPAVIHGPGNVANLHAMVEAIDRGRFFLCGSNDNVKSLVSLTNVCAALSFLLHRDARGAEIFNLVDPESYSVRALAAMIAEKLGRNQPPTVPAVLLRVGAWCGDALQRITGRNMPLNGARLRALLETTHFSCARLMEAGFVHPQTTAQGLDDMITAYRVAGKGARR